MPLIRLLVFIPILAIQGASMNAQNDFFNDRMNQIIQLLDGTPGLSFGDQFPLRSMAFGVAILGPEPRVAGQFEYERQFMGAYFEQLNNTVDNVFLAEGDAIPSQFDQILALSLEVVDQVEREAPEPTRRSLEIASLSSDCSVRIFVRDTEIASMAHSSLITDSPLEQLEAIAAAVAGSFTWNLRGPLGSLLRASSDRIDLTEAGGAFPFAILGDSEGVVSTLGEDGRKSAPTLLLLEPGIEVEVTVTLSLDSGESCSDRLMVKRELH